MRPGESGAQLAAPRDSARQGVRRRTRSTGDEVCDVRAVVHVRVDMIVAAEDRRDLIRRIIE